MKLRSFSIESCDVYVMKVKVKVMMVVIIQMSLLEEKTPSKQFVMPKEVLSLPLSLPSPSLSLSLPSLTHSSLPLSCPLPLHIHYSPHIHYLTTHTLQVGSMVVYLCSEDARQVTGSTLTIDGGWTTR